MKFLVQWDGPRNNHFIDFGVNTDHDLAPGILQDSLITVKISNDSKVLI